MKLKKLFFIPFELGLILIFISDISEMRSNSNNSNKKRISLYY